MNIQEPSMDGTAKAVLEYLDGDFRIVQPGAYVLCEVTGQRIPIDELRYWSVSRQEAYVSASAVDKRRQQLESGEAE
jgi:hypothetical protein